MTNKMELDLAALSDDQLAVLEKIAGDQVAAERQRRQSYETSAEAFTDLFQKAADLRARFEALRGSPAAKEVKASGILETLTRFHNFAVVNGLEFTAPSIPTYIKPALKTPSVAATPAPAVAVEGEQAPTVAETTEAPKKGKKGEQAPAEAGAAGAA